MEPKQAEDEDGYEPAKRLNANRRRPHRSNRKTFESEQNNWRNKKENEYFAAAVQAPEYSSQ
jgi:hypothetical protein